MRRQAFTLVEMLVAVALIVLIMSIVSQAFVEGLESFRQLKAIGDLQEELRSAAVPLRNDLLAPHFDPSRKLSDDPKKPNYRATSGFFRIQQPLFPNPLPPPNPTPVSSYPEGQDNNGLWSYTAQTMPTPAKATSLNGAILHFTVAIPTGNMRRSDFLTTLIPPPNDPASQLSQQGPLDYRPTPGTTPYWMISQWAEVCWFLWPLMDGNQQVTATVPNGGGTAATPLWVLYRRQRLLVTDPTLAKQVNTVNRVPVAKLALLSEVCCKPDPLNLTSLYFPQPSEVAQPPLGPGRRAMMDPLGTMSNPIPIGTNDDLVLSDVISFEVKVLFAGSYQFQDVVDAQRARGQMPTGTFTAYDTATTPQNMYQIKALQITLRVWDYKTEQTRQVTIIQDM